MGPNITHGTNFTGLLRYLLFEPDGFTPRNGSEVLGGTLAGQEFQELAREFDLVRRLRPGAAKVVMHHSLSYATGEFPSDENLLRDAERYLEHLGLQAHPFVVIRHADKDHLHSHLVISKTGFAREWWDARLDRPRAQIAAALVEREFGLVEMERPRMRRRIDAAWARLNGAPIGVLSEPGFMRVPGPGESLPEPPVPAPKKPVSIPPIPVGEDGVLQQIRKRMESIPDGLSVIDWVYALEVEGVVARPNMKGGRISGWWVQLAESDSAPVKLSAVDRAGKGPRPALGWAALMKSDRVFYNPEVHNESLSQLAEVSFGKPVEFTPAESRYASDEFPRDPESLRWEWQPEEPPPGSQNLPELVEGLVDPGDRSGTFRPRPGHLAEIKGAEVRRPSEETHPLEPGLGKRGHASPHVAARVRPTLGRIRGVPSASRPGSAPGSHNNLGGGFPLGGSNLGAAPHPGQPSDGSGALPGGGNRSEATPGPHGYPDLHDLSSRRFPADGRRGPQGNPGSRRPGMRVDRRGVEAVRLQRALEAAGRAIRVEALGQALRCERGAPRRTCLRALPPLMLSPAAKADLETYVRAFFAGELRRLENRRSAAGVLDHSPKVPSQEIPPSIAQDHTKADLKLGLDSSIGDDPEPPDQEIRDPKVSNSKRPRRL